MSIKEGFWYSEYEPHLPMPVKCEEDWDKDAFLLALDHLEVYLNAQNKVQRYRGFSICRVCGIPNGSDEYEFQGYVWPSGYKHYIEEHGVMPSDGFMLNILYGALSIGTVNTCKMKGK